jgi:protocatechuate 3,4-dioxygenase beta subunit
MNGKALVVLLLVVGLGLVVWLAFARGGDAAPGTPAPGTQPGASAAPSAAATGKADLAKGELAGRPAAAAPTGAATERTAAPAAAPVPAADADVARIRGRIVDGRGQPRAGVKLDLESWAVSGEGEVPLPPMPGRRDDKPSTTTAADGTFAFALGKDRAGMLDLASADLVFAGEPPTVRGRKGDQDLGDLAALAAATVAGVVQDERGQPVADVRVAATFGGFGLGIESSSKTDAEGRFRVGKLRPGKWGLRTASSAFLPTTEEFSIEAEEQKTGVVLVMKKGLAIAGQVVDDRGVPVAGSKVGARRHEARGGVDIARFTSDEATTTDEHGFFTLTGLQGETATVRATGDDHTTAVAKNVAVGTGNLLLRVERCAAIEGVLRGADGTPIAGSRVSARPTRAGGAAGEPHAELAFDVEAGLPFGRPGARSTTASDGTFRLEGVAPGAVTLHAEGKTHRPVVHDGVTLQPAQVVTGIRLVADLGATARVKVTDEAGQPIAKAAVRVVAPRRNESPDAEGAVYRARRVEHEDGEVRILDGDEALGSARTDDQGIALVTGLPAGAAILQATHADLAAARPSPIVLPSAGTVDASLTLRRPGFAELRVFEADGSPSPGALYRVRGPLGNKDDEREVDGAAAADGTAKVGPLAAGEYEALLELAAAPQDVGGAMVFTTDERRSVSEPLRFAVAAGETSTVELRRSSLTRVHGTVTGADGPIAGCVVELGKADEPEVRGVPGLGGGPSVRTRADGTFVLQDVEPGRYELRYGKPEQIVKAYAPIEVARGQAELRQDLELRTGKLRVQAWSKVANAAIEGVEVEIAPAKSPQQGARREQRVMMISMRMDGGENDTTTMTMGARSAKTGADGYAEIDDVPAGTYTVKLKHDDHAPIEVHDQVVAEAQTTDCGRREMTQAGSIRGTVVAADGKPVRMALVQCQAKGGRGEPERQPAMGGSFRFDGLAPGTYVLRAQELTMSPGGAGPGRSGPDVEVEVKGGETAAAEVRTPAK